VPATVPGGIYSDLEDNSDYLGSEIYHEYNDMENRWVGRMNWTFTRNFEGAIKINGIKNGNCMLNSISYVFILIRPIFSYKLSPPKGKSGTGL